MSEISGFDPRYFAWVHYEPGTGVIRQTSHGPFDVRELLLAEVETLPEGGVDILRQRVDLASVVAGCCACRLTDVPENEVPQLDWIGRLKLDRGLALDRCDKMMLPHRPMPDKVRAAWAAYMQALRDLGSHKTPAAFVAAWPLRPDGGDDIAAIRAAFAAQSMEQS